MGREASTVEGSKPGTHGATGTRARRLGRGALEVTRKSVRAALELYAGSTRAAADGARTFQKQLEVKRILDPSSERGLVAAALAGYAAYFQGMAKVSQELAERLREPSSRS